MTNDLKVDGVNLSKKLKEATVFDKTSELCKDADLTKVICVDGKNETTKSNVCIGETGTALLTDLAGKSYVLGVSGFPINKLSQNGTITLCTSGTFVSKLSAFSSFIKEHVGDNYCK